MILGFRHGDISIGRTCSEDCGGSVLKTGSGINVRSRPVANKPYRNPSESISTWTLGGGSSSFSKAWYAQGEGHDSNIICANEGVTIEIVEGPKRIGHLIALRHVGGGANAASAKAVYRKCSISPLA